MYMYVCECWRGQKRALDHRQCKSPDVGVLGLTPVLCKSNMHSLLKSCLFPAPSFKVLPFRC